MLQEPANAPFPDVSMVPVWIPDFLYDDVWQYGIPDMAGCIRRTESSGSGEAAVDDPRAMGLGLHSGQCAGLGCTVQLRVLWPDADFGYHRAGGDGAL